LAFIAQPLWYDEYFTLTIARLFPSANFWQVVFSDVHPPTWYAVSWLFAFDGADWLIRVPSLVAGVGVMFAVGALAKTLYGDDAVQPALWLMAVMPAQVYYSTEGRVYAAITLAVLLAVLAMQTNRRWLYLVAAGSLGWLHAIGFVHLAAVSAVALWQWRKDRRAWLYVLGAGGLSALWLPQMLWQSADVINGFWLPPFDWGALVFNLTDMTTRMALPTGLWWTVFLLPSLVAIGLVSFKPTVARVTALIVAIAPPLVVGVISSLGVNSYLTRAFLPSVTLALAVLVAPMLIGRRALLGGLCGLLAICTLLTTPRYDVRGLFDGCEQIYYGSTAAAMMGVAIRPDLVPHVRLNPDDLNQTFSADAKDALGFVYEIPRGEFCAFRMHTVYTLPAETAHFAALEALVTSRRTVEFSDFWRAETTLMENAP
jgi:uncharacterized membrane protein